MKREATRRGCDVQRLRQLLVFDRFLTRTFSIFGEAAVLKGGMVLQLRVERARATKDIDLSLLANVDEVLGKLQSAGRLDLGDFLRFEVQPDPNQPVLRVKGLESRRFRAEAQLAGKIYGSRFGIDVVIADTVLGKPEMVQGPEFLAFAGIEPASFRVYPIEMHIAEKLHAYTQPRERPNSRVKDLPDFALLASIRPIEAGALRDAILQAFGKRETHPAPTSFLDPPVLWGPVYAEMARNDGLAWASIEELTGLVRRFLDPVLQGGSGCWDPKAWVWGRS